MRNFDCATESKGNYLYQPYDFLLMSSKVPSDWNLILIDAIADRLGVDETLARIRSSPPAIIVLAMADTNWDQDKKFLERIRREFSESKILVCGDSFQEMSCRMQVRDFSDGVILNPLSIDFTDLKSLDNDNAQVFLKKPVKVRAGLPRHDLFLNPKYRWPFAKHFLYTTVFTAWGCPYSCSYCIMSKFPNLWRPVDDVVAELEYVKKLGIREVYIGDRSFGASRETSMLLLENMIRKRFEFSWSTYFHPNQYHPELLETMARSGCHTIIVGIESLNEENLEKYGRRVRKESFQGLIRHARRLGIEICGDFIIGLPGDTYSDIQKTIQFSKSIDIQYASFNIAAPLPGSVLRERAILAGIMHESEHHYDSLGRNRVLGNDELDGETILKLRNSAIREFYLRPGYLLKRATSIRGLEHLVIQAQEAFQILAKSGWPNFGFPRLR